MKKTNNWKPEYKYETLTGKFTDYRGQDRDFTMVAVSIPVKKDEIMEVIKLTEVNEQYGLHFTIPTSMCNVTKVLSIGVAVRNAHDTMDQDLAVRIAYGKAVTLMNHTLYVSHPGMINTKMVNALLEQEATFFMRDPGSYIKAYNDDKAKYLSTGKIANAELAPNEIQSTTSGTTNEIDHTVTRKSNRSGFVSTPPKYTTTTTDNFINFD